MDHLVLQLVIVMLLAVLIGLAIDWLRKRENRRGVHDTASQQMAREAELRKALAESRRVCAECRAQLERARAALEAAGIAHDQPAAGASR